MTDFRTSGSAEHTQLHVPLSRGAVSSVSLASTDLLSYVELLPLNQLVVTALVLCGRGRPLVEMNFFVFSRRLS